MLEAPSKRATPLPSRLRQLLAPLHARDHHRRSPLRPRRTMTSFAAERASLVSNLRSVRWVSIFLGIGNLGVFSLGCYLVASLSPGCWGEARLPALVVAVVAGVRIMSMFGAALAQMETAATIANGLEESSVAVDAVVRLERRLRYKRWLWWTRFGMAITMLQFLGALYLTIIVWRDFSYGINSRECFLVQETESRGWKQGLVVFFLVLVWIVVIIQCVTGSDVLRWRSFYATHDTAWKAHYQEVFDHGIREALCCLGRVKYMSVLEEDEVYSVARLLGDLVAYRASGTGHLELLAGLALLQRHRHMPKLYDEPVEAPEALIREAAILHQFAEAAYTGPLLDVGRNPILFPCAWLYRQGVLTPWTRNRRPVLEGDNWWRGHAAAFLKYVNLSPEALRRGRVCQLKREAAYFVVVLHHVKTVVIAVRGTETPEDLITDGLCRECALTVDDLDGLINSGTLSPDVRQRVLSSFPHYGHSGIVESARELFMQLDGQPGNKDDLPSENTGFLSSLLGPGRECQGYKIRVVGHSLGGAVAAVLGLRLYGRYPDLHVYSYGTLPCVDKIVAEACSEFVTSIVYNDEFSARLSVNSIIRLRAAAMTALSDNSSAESATIYKLARRILHTNKPQESREDNGVPALSCQSANVVVESGNQRCRRKHVKYTVKGGVFLCSYACSCMLNMPSHYPCKTLKDCTHELSSGIMLEPNGISHKRGSGLTAGSGGHEEYPFRESASLIDGNCADTSEDGVIDLNNRDVLEQTDVTSSSNMACFLGSDHLISLEDHASLDNTSSSIQVSIGETSEMFLPGLVIHVVPDQKSILPLWNSWRIQDGKHGYRAFLANREGFKDIIITPYMFLDHLPWRCHYAMRKVLETRRAEGRLNVDSSNGEHAV